MRSFPKIGMKKKWNHHPVYVWSETEGLLLMKEFLRQSQFVGSWSHYLPLMSDNISDGSRWTFSINTILGMRTDRFQKTYR